MPSIEISEAQRDYLDDLRAELADEHVGQYGAVRDQDALQYLIDHVEDDAESRGGTAESSDTGRAGESEPPGDPGDRLEAMMNLLDDHQDKWSEVDREDGKYEVTLPDDTTETVRTKDDVRALLFQHY
jgi:hypothetical protein